MNNRQLQTHAREKRIEAIGIKRTGREAEQYIIVLYERVLHLVTLRFRLIILIVGK